MKLVSDTANVRHAYTGLAIASGEKQAIMRLLWAILVFFQGLRSRRPSIRLSRMSVRMCAEARSAQGR
jgi:hypothetical protein